MHDTRPPWMRAKWTACVVAMILATATILGAAALGYQLSELTQAALASTYPAAISLYQTMQGKQDVSLIEAKEP